MRDIHPDYRAARVAVIALNVVAFSLLIGLCSFIAVRQWQRAHAPSPDVFAAWSCACSDGSACLLERNRTMPAPDGVRRYATFGNDEFHYLASCRAPAELQLIDERGRVFVSSRAPHVGVVRPAYHRRT